MFICISLCVVMFALCTFLMYYFALPILNPMSIGFWLFLIYEICLFIGLSAICIYRDSSNSKYSEKKSNQYKMFVGIPSGIIGVIIVLLIIMGLASTPMFRASSYASLIENSIVHKNTSEYTPTIDDVPLMDKDTAELLASRTMGTLVEEVSQFVLSESVQINYQGKPIRVVPLAYGGFFKWINNRDKGIPSYITVDMVSQKTEIHNLEQGIRYSPSGYFNDDLRRLLRFKYPTTLLDEPVFEIDETGKPYWVVSKLKHRVGLFGGTDVGGILVVDALTGDIEEYSMDNIPKYVDNACPTEILINLYDSYGQYRGGFLNSIFGQKGVVKATDGYNYIPQNNDIYVYTGVTSVVSDESNVGFIYVNKRTRQYEYYEVAGAEEYSAMASAEGVVQHLGYTSTFPLLLSIENQPTYCVALKDAGGLVKMYGLVNMPQYQIVVTGNTISECLSKYRIALKNNGETVSEIQTSEKQGTIEDIRTANLEGTTYFYVKIKNDSVYYSFNVMDNEEIVLLNVGDFIKFEIEDGVENKIIKSMLID